MTLNHSYLKSLCGLTVGTVPSMTPLSSIDNAPLGSSNGFNLSNTDGLEKNKKHKINFLSSFKIWPISNGNNLML